ncbi:MAG TPA: helix-turn-helix domain-containing protein [Solirubrobacteraceae bacterium]|nr:helix-turn-helix domain-containing protein [Solirubrobacteraceae bacterium]
MIVRTADELTAIVRDRRHELGITQEELADIIDVHRAFVSQLERGKISVRFDLLLRLVQALGLDLELRPRGQ